MSLAYDASDGYVLLFGGTPSNQIEFASNETWTFQNGTWTNITLNAGTAPQPRVGMAMTYDNADGYVLAFGGQVDGSCNGGLSVCNDTWEFHAGHWTELSPIYVLPGSSKNLGGMGTDAFGMMTYDAAEGYVLLKGGQPGDGTYSYRAGVWTNWNYNVSNNNTPILQPGDTFMPGLAYDPTDGYVVYFGGVSGNGHDYLGSWKWQGGVWTNITSWSASSPHPRVVGGLTWDATDGYLLLFGGDFLNCTMGGPNCENGVLDWFNDTWSFIGGNWTKLTPPVSPSPRSDSGMAFDTIDQEVLLFGGQYQPAGTLFGDNQTWTWGSTPPLAGLTVSDAISSPLPGVQDTFSASFSGGVAPYTYSWRFGDGGTSSSPNPSHAFAAIGSYTTTLWLNDSASHSTVASIGVHVYVPLAIPQVSASQDPAIFGTPVNFTSVESGGTQPYTYSWNFGDGGVGGNLSSITHAYTTNGPFMVVLTVTDAVDAVERGYLNVTIALSVTLSGNVTEGSVPLAVGFSTLVRGGTPGYIYSWVFGDGSLSSLSNPSHVYATPGDYRAELFVNDTSGHSAEASWNITAAPGGIPLTISLETNPSPVVLGNTSVITAEPVGGHGSYTLSWPGLPSWCHARSPETVACQPLVPGNYPIVVVVTDSAGTSATASTVLAVSDVPSPLSISVEATPAALSLGNLTLISATPAGGQGTYVITWPALPNWCIQASSTSLVCQPNQVGKFAIDVNVIDSTGASASASTTVVVTGSPTPHGPAAGLFGLPGSDGVYLLIILITLALISMGVARAALSKEDTFVPRKSTETGPYSGFQKVVQDSSQVTIKPLKEGEADPASDLF